MANGNNRPERVGPPGMSNRAPSGAAPSLTRVGRGRGGPAGSTGTGINENRRRRIEAARARATAAREDEEELKKNASEENTRIGSMGLGLFLFSAQLKETDAATRALGKIIQERVNEQFGRETTMGGMKYKIVELVGRNARFKELFSLTEEYGVSYDTRGNLPKNTIFDLKIKISKGEESKYGVVTFFNGSAKMLIKGGYFNCNNSTDFAGLEGQPRALLMALFQMYGYKPPLPTLLRRNTVASFRLGRKFDEKAFRTDTYGKREWEGFTLNKVPVKTKSVTKTYMRVGSDPHEVSVTKMGVVQVSFKGPITKSILNKYFSKIKTFSRIFSRYLKGKSVVAKKRRGASIRTNAAPAPNLARRGTTCHPDKRPTPYSFAGKCPTGMYVKPNPQQQPCCYNVGKQPSRMKEKVKMAYNRASVKIPKNVEELFGITSNKTDTNVAKGEPNIQLFKTVTKVRRANGTMENVPNVRIGSRQCLRYTKEKILDFILRMGYAEAGLEAKTKEELCKILYDLTKNTGLNKTNNRYIPSVGFMGKSVQLTIKMGDILMVGRRECQSLAKKDMQKLCRTLGIRFEGMSRPDMCKLINEKRINMQTVLNNKKENQVNVNMKKNVSGKIAAEGRAANLQVAKNRKRDEVLYGMFITRIEPFVQKYEAQGSRAEVPTKTQMLANYRVSVELNLTNAVTNLNKRGWKKKYTTWLTDYTDQFKSVYGKIFKNNKARAEENMRIAGMEAKNKAKALKERKAVEAKLTKDMAKADMNKFSRKLPEKLRNVFNKRRDEFATNYRNFVLTNATRNVLASRKRAYFQMQDTVGDIRRYLEKYVANMPSKRINNKRAQRYFLNKNFKLVLGPVIQSEVL